MPMWTNCAPSYSCVLNTAINLNLWLSFIKILNNNCPYDILIVNISIVHASKTNLCTWNEAYKTNNFLDSDIPYSVVHFTHVFMTKPKRRFFFFYRPFYYLDVCIPLQRFASCTKPAKLNIDMLHAQNQLN